MAVEKVEAILNKETTQLQEQKADIYGGDLIAPKKSGNYDLALKAYDTAGNIAIADPSNTRGLVIEVSKWHTPKTDWKRTDRFNIVDYNRIKNNLEYLHEQVSIYYRPFSIHDMGADKGDAQSDYESYWNYVIFNFFEENLDFINKNMWNENFGIAQQFFSNGAFIQWNELNRIESACFKMYDILTRQKAGFTRLSFRLGNMKGIKT